MGQHWVTEQGPDGIQGRPSASPANGVCVIMVTNSLVLVLFFFFFLTLKVKRLILKCPQEIEILGSGLSFFV